MEGKEKSGISRSLDGISSLPPAGNFMDKSAAIGCSGIDFGVIGIVLVTATESSAFKHPTNAAKDPKVMMMAIFIFIIFTTI